MGFQLTVYGKIDGIQSLSERNALVLDSLPEQDEWPWLVKRMFTMPAPWPQGTYRSQCIHFGATFKDDPSDPSRFFEWIEKFEGLLKKLYWISANLHLEREFEAHDHMFIWFPTPKGFESLES